MPVVDINAGNPLRFENGGKVRIFNSGGSQDYNIFLIEAGTLQIDDAHTEGIPVSDRAVLSEVVVDGDERPSMIRLSCKATKLGLTNATELLALIRPAAASGLKTLYKIEIDIYDSRGGSTGTRITATKCWVPDPVNYRAGGAGPNLDLLDIAWRSEGASVTWATF